MTEMTPSPSAETVADSRESERHAPLQEGQQLEGEKARLEKAERKAVKRYHRERQLRSYQAELVKLQQHVERRNERVLILLEGRDAAGRGGTIRRVTRYMNPRHYRVVALGRPTEEQLNQWYLQRYVAHFPTGGEIVLFDRSWYNRAMVEPVFGFAQTRSTSCSCAVSLASKRTWCGRE
jgi:polyphosphate kinase 2 (PPK2 family)